MTPLPTWTILGLQVGTVPYNRGIRTLVHLIGHPYAWSIDNCNGVYVASHCSVSEQAVVPDGCIGASQATI